MPLWSARRALARARRRPTTEERLLDGDTIPLHLGPNLVISVNLRDGLSKRFSETGEMDDREGYQLLLATRAALYSPEPTPRRGDLQAIPDPANPALRTIPIALTHRQSKHVGDTLAAYFRLIHQE